MKYISGRIVRGIYTWLGWSGEVAEPIGSGVPVSSETSAIRTQTPGNHPKRNKLCIKSWLRGHDTGLFGALSVFGRHIKGMIPLRPEQVWTCSVTRHHRPLVCHSFHP